MPYVLSMQLTPEQAAALHLATDSAGLVEWWYLKPEPAVQFVTHWLPNCARARVRLFVSEGDRQKQFREIGPAPIPNCNPSPEELARPVVPGVIECSIRHTTRRPPFLPLCLPGSDTRQAVERYLEGCTLDEIKRWLRRVGEMHYIGEAFPAASKWLLATRTGYELLVDLVHEPGMVGIHIVY